MVTATRTKEVRMALEDYIYVKHRDKYVSHFGGLFDVHRKMVKYKRKIDKHKNKWYRRFFYKYIKNK